MAGLWKIWLVFGRSGWLISPQSSTLSDSRKREHCGFAKFRYSVFAMASVRLLQCLLPNNDHDYQPLSDDQILRGSVVVSAILLA